MITSCATCGGLYDDGVEPVQTFAGTPCMCARHSRTHNYQDFRALRLKWLEAAARVTGVQAAIYVKCADELEAQLRKTANN